jgi:hypothetical protein
VLVQKPLWIEARRIGGLKQALVSSALKDCREKTSRKRRQSRKCYSHGTSNSEIPSSSRSSYLTSDILYQRQLLLIL